MGEQTGNFVGAAQGKRLSARCLIFLIVLVLVWEGLSQAWAATLPVQRIEQSPFSNQKLSGIIDILQDSHGFIWLATETGLLRYDGLNTVKYESLKNNPNSLSSQYCWSLIEDHQGKIWIATENGLNQFDPANKTFTRYLNDPENPSSLSHNFSTKVIETKQGEIYVATAGGLTRISKRRDDLQQFRKEDPNSFLLSNRVRTVMEDSEGDIWLGYEDSGASRWNPKTNKVQHFRYRQSAEFQAGELGLVYFDVREITEDEHGYFWIGTFGGGVTRLDLKNHQAKHFPITTEPNGLPSGVIWDVFSDSRGTLWVSMDKGGVARFDYDTETFEHFRHNPFDHKTLLYDTVKDIYEDNQGNYWFATFPSGLNRHHPLMDQFSTWYHRVNDSNSLSNSAILSLARSRDGLIWIGTESGLNVLDEASGSITRYLHDPNDPSSLPSGAVLSVVEGPQGAIWVGTWGKGLAKLHRETGEFDHFGRGDGPHQVKSLYIWKVFFDDRQRLWLATETDGINLYNPETDTFESFTHSKADSDSISFNYVWDIEQSHNGHMWIGTQHGLNLFDPEARRFKRFAELDSFQGLGNARIHAVLEDRDGFVWVATQSSGLKRWDPQTETIVSLTMESGLPSNTVSSILQDNEGYIWASTVEGIVKVEPKKVVVEAILNQFSGIAGDNHNRNASLKGPDGAFFFGSTEGLTRFAPTELTFSDYEPGVTLTNIYVLNKPANFGDLNSPLERDISQAKTVVLDHDDNMVTLEFSSLDFGRAGKLRFAYRLDGFDSDWNIVQSHNQATYTNLDPGRYVFKVRRQKSNGDWSKDITELTLQVRPPPWSSPLAYIVYACVLVAFIYLLARLILLRLLATRLNDEVHKRTQELVHANSAKTQFLTNMSRELRTPLNAIVGYSKRLMAKHKSNSDPQGNQALDEIYRNGQHLLGLINDIMDLSTIESGNMKLNFTPCHLPEIVNECIADLQDDASAKGVAILPPNNYAHSVIHADQQRLKQIIYNLLSNGIKYTDRGHVAIVVDTRSQAGKQYCTLSVIDTGRGIRKEDQEKLFKRFELLIDESRQDKGFGAGLGLALVSEFASLHGGYVTCQSTYGEGSQFTVFLPIASKITDENS